MEQSVSVYINVRENGTFGISIDIPIDMIRNIGSKELNTEDNVVEELAKNWMGTEVQPEKTM